MVRSGDESEGAAFQRIFTNAFQAAIEWSRDENTWNLLNDILVAAQQELDFLPPNVSFNGVSGDVSTRTLTTRDVFDSFARCFACAVARSKSMPPEPAVMSTEFGRCRRAWESDTFEYDIVAPVTGVHLAEFDILPLGGELGLAWESKLSEASKHRLSTFGKELFHPPSPTVLYGQRTIRKSGNLNDLVRDSCADVKRCVTAIRLATGKTVGCDTVHIVPSELCFQTFNGLSSYVIRLGETTVHGQHDLMGSAITDVEAQEVARIEALLASNTSKLVIAVERFNWAIGRLTPEDQVIDLAISLESMLCRGGGDQLSYRFRLFGAAILAGTIGGEYAFDLLRGLYRARSSVVHGGKRMSEVTKEEGMKAVFAGRSISDFIGECRELGRRILLELLGEAVKGRSPEQYVLALEAAMIRQAKKLIPASGPGGEGLSPVS